MSGIPPEYLDSIVTGDARELAAQIPDASVDLVLCDPVYWQIDDYAWLAQTAARVLKDSGNVIAQTSSLHRYDAETAMRGYGLEPCDLLAEVYPFALNAVYPFKTFIGWKAHIWFTKGKRDGGWIVNRFRGGGRNKDDHEWGDSIQFSREIVVRLTEPDAVVLDPFVGSGTVPAVCKMLGRHWIGFEIDDATAERARQRVALTQTPLFVPEPEQLELEVE